jgi:hypothetical protein
MEYSIVKQSLATCPDLQPLDDTSAADLLWRAEVLHCAEGEVIYAENTDLDHTFCLLLSGDLVVERAGAITGGIAEQQVFGEMAYFTNHRMRTATVRVGSSQAVVLKFHMTPAELDSPRLAALRRCLFLRTWDRFVSTSQNGLSPEELALAN